VLAEPIRLVTINSTTWQRKQCFALRSQFLRAPYRNKTVANHDAITIPINWTAEASATGSVETKEARLNKLKARRRALLDRAKILELRIKRAESAEKRTRKKPDDRTKLLLGVAISNPPRSTPLRAQVDRARLPVPDSGISSVQRSAGPQGGE
jgi:hypothetical protein